MVRFKSLHPTSPALPPSAWLTVCVALSCLLGCGGGGGGGGSTPQPPTQPPPPTASVSYSSDAAATNNSLSLTSSVSGRRLSLTVRATNVGDLGGVAFDLVYPAGQLTFVSASELADFAGGNQTSFQVVQQNGRLIVGLARLGTNGFGGSADLIRIEFDAGTAGSGRLDFENRSGTRGDGTAIGLLDWIGGSVTVN